MNPSLHNQARKGEAGQALILFVLALGVLCGFVAMSIDVGLILQERRQLQNAADAAALAGAQELPDSPAVAVAVAQQYAEAHGVDLTDPGYTFVATTPYLGDPGKIEVTISHDVGFIFGRVLGLDFANVPARAVAGTDPLAGYPVTDASLVTLNPTQCDSLAFIADDDVFIHGPIMVNSNCATWGGTITSDDTFNAYGGIQSVGGFTVSGSCNNCTPVTIPPFEDPLKDVLPPCFPNSPGPCQDLGALPVRNGTYDNPQTVTSSSFDFQPGIYYGGIDVNSADLAPGYYIIAGGGFNVNNLSGDGIFIYNTNDPDCPSCADGGFGPVNITEANASTMDSGAYPGLFVFQDRANNQQLDFNSDDDFTGGTVYAASAHVRLVADDDARLQIIADTIYINTDDAFNAPFVGTKFFGGGGTGPMKLVE